MDPYAAPPRLVAALAAAVAGLAAASHASAEVVPACVFGALAWFLVYDLMVRVFFTYGGPWARASPGREDEPPRADALVALAHQGVLYPLIFLCCLAQRWDDWGAFWSGPVGDDMLPRHLFLAMIGYEAKDFIPGRRLSAVLALHHSFVFLGCTVCLLAPTSLGLLSTVVVVAEAGSACYNLDALLPGRAVVRGIYQVAMLASNIASVRWAAEFYAGGAGSVRTGFVVTVGLLLVLRTTAQVLECRTYCRPAAYGSLAPGLPAKDKPSAQAPGSVLGPVAPAFGKVACAVPASSSAFPERRTRRASMLAGKAVRAARPYAGRSTRSRA